MVQVAEVDLDKDALTGGFDVGAFALSALGFFAKDLGMNTDILKRWTIKIN